jgi:hypothetical protein
MSKKHIQKARKARLQELKHLLSEAKSFSVLQENKRLPAFQKKANHFISEYNRLVGAYGALLMLEFYEQGTKETLAVLKTIQQNNRDNEIGAFLSDLNMDKLVAAMDAITGQETAATQAAGGFKAGKNMAHAGYGSGGFTGNLGPGVGAFRAVEEAIYEGLFGFGSKKSTEEPYEPTASKLYDKSGKHVGTFGAAELTAKGKASELTKSREQLMDEYQKEMPKVVAFIDAYLGMFTDENKKKLTAGKGFFGSPAASLIQKEFGKVPGFNTKIFAQEIAEDPEIVANNVAMATRPANFSALTSLEDAMNKVRARANKSVGSRLVDMFSSFGGSARGMKTMFESK